MAVRASITTITKNKLDASWAGLLQSSSDTGAPVDVSRYNKICVQVKGTFGAGGTVTWQGSFDGGTTWGALGAGVTSTDTKVTNILERPALIRPNVTGGDGTTNVTAMLVASE